jgi:hypothetical protein
MSPASSPAARRYRAKAATMASLNRGPARPACGAAAGGPASISKESLKSPYICEDSIAIPNPKNSALLYFQQTDKTVTLIAPG